MAYSSSIPQASDQLRNSQPALLANFQSIEAAFIVNHVGFNEADAGKHKYVTFPRQSTAPTQVGNDRIVYGKLLGDATQLYVSTSTATKGYPFTIHENSGGSGGDGWTALASGVLLKWGNGTAKNTAGGFSNKFVSGGSIPTFTTVFQVYITSRAESSSMVTVASFTTTTFNAYSSSGDRAVNYLAIGTFTAI